MIKRLLLLLTGLLVTALGAQALSVRRAAARVAPELRGPRLLISFSWVPLGVLPLMRRFLRADTPLGPGVAVRHRTVTSPEGTTVDVVVYDAGSRPSPSGALLWIHGGGHLVGDPGIDHALCSRFVLEAGVPVVSVDYRLAPEDPYPADLDDCYAALRWLQTHTDELGVDPSRVAVGGASAGGGLAAATVQRAHDAGHPVCFQLLEYPMLDDRTALVTDQAGRGRFVWTARMNRRAWSAYLGGPAGSEGVLPAAAPARRTDLTGLPPAWIGVGDQDLFHDEDLAYARRLRTAGVACALHVEPGMYHGADSVAPDAPSMTAFRGRMVDALRDAVARH
ncbi:alpha/beta hydrolase [Actinomycetospora endophytica]|uniref:Alpha/beta hydrolase n=1 Tax=Actinomycetospora endophytica TaxID=2291215 RepID=A0ABS8PCM5_9PSEU|nr:alpha/beta hydrolase [Actinomycetospora endophytica]MCD2196022.1 alpha/beta hydrolase [Actinomycetospora endophytica]